MNIKENIGLILIVIGIILNLTIILFFIGIPLIIIGTYLLNKKVNQKEKDIEGKLKDKKRELVNIDTKLEEMEIEKEKEINIKLKEKQEELDSIDSRMEQKEKEKEKEINILLSQKKEELANIDNKLKEKEEKSEKEINIKLKEKQEELANIDIKLEKEAYDKQKQIDIKIKEKNAELNKIYNTVELKKKELIFLDDEIEMQDIGLYMPKYDFLTAVSYKEKLEEVRKKQKEMYKNKTDVVGGDNWTVDGSKQKGRAMNNANKKLLGKNFNLECDTIINKVTVSNRDNSLKRINKAFESLNKLNERNLIRITPEYLSLKVQELDIAIEYALKKQEEKEQLRESKEREREERKIQKQLDAQEKKINDAKEKAKNELKTAEKELNYADDGEREKLEEEIKRLKLALDKSNKDIADITEKRKRTGAGYVYILSNIGSFGENTYKIGVTRRDDPMGRVTELSDASVPFRFDNHVFIFSEEAFELEKELHDRFDHKRVNKVNKRKEFFNITLDDVKKIVEENKNLVHSFVEKPEAQEYYDTLKMMKK